jgi:hypothetical protein
MLFSACSAVLVSVVASIVALLGAILCWIDRCQENHNGITVEKKTFLRGVSRT